MANKIKRSGLEYFVIVAVVGFAMVLSIALYARRDRVCKSYQLIWELMALRNYVVVSILENKKYPDGLKDLLTPKQEGKKSEPQSGVEGEISLIPGVMTPGIKLRATRAPIIDPFGNPYQYNAQTGWVMSTTPGFENW